MTAQTVELGEKMLPLKVAVTNTSAALLRLVGWIVEYRTSLATLAAGLTLATKWERIHSGLLKFKISIQKAANATVREGIAAAKSASIATNLLAAAKHLLVGNLKVATVHMRAFNAALKANPIGAIITVVTLLGAAIGGLVTKMKKQKKAQKELTEAVVNCFRNFYL